MLTVYEKLIAVNRQIETLESAQVCRDDAFQCLKRGDEEAALNRVEKSAQYLWGNMRPKYWRD